MGDKRVPKRRVANKRKRIALITISYLLVVATLIGFALYLTFAKYTDEIGGRISILPATFNAMFSGNNMIENLEETGLTLVSADPDDDEIGGGKKIRAFSDEIKLTEAVPGMPIRNVPFTISNGTNEADVSSIALKYTIRLRTSNNLPLRFTITANHPDGTTTKYVRNDSYSIEIKNNGDAPTYIYTFYEEGNELKTEPTFNMAAGVLTADSYVFNVDWPIVPENAASHASNDAIYMKEVDAIELYVSIMTLQSEEIHTTPAHSFGVIDLYHKNADATFDYTYKESNGTTSIVVTDSFTHRVDYRAFVDDRDDDGEKVIHGDDTVDKVYEFMVTNGNDLLSDGKLISEVSARTTYYSIFLKVPYNKDTMNYKYALKYRDYTDIDNDGDLDEWMELDPYGDVEYRLYNIDYESVIYQKYRVLDPENEDDAETMLTFTGEEAEYTRESNRLFKIIKFALKPSEDNPEPGEYVRKIENVDNTDETIYDYHEYKLYVEDCVNFQAGNNPVDNRLEIIVDAAYTNESSIRVGHDVSMRYGEEDDKESSSTTSDTTNTPDTDGQS